MNDKRYLKVKMLNLEQEVQALLAKGENLGPGVYDAIAEDIETLTTQIVNLRKKSKPTTAADTETPETEVKESIPLSLENLYKEIKAVPGNTGLGNEDNEDRQMYYFVGVVVAPGGGNLTFVNAVPITGSTLMMKGMGSSR